ncbi:MAG: hypothetical protein ACREKH_20100 [Candidatus Rokuibacteriota bacterium]
MRLRRLFLVTLPVYFAWEMLQMPAFGGLPEGWLVATGVCALATIGDAVVVLLLFALAVLTFRDPRWFAPPRISRYAAIVTAGLMLQIMIEWVAVYRLGWWSYRDVQPIVPGLGVGVLPLLQPIALLPLTFWLLARWRTRT